MSDTTKEITIRYVSGAYQTNTIRGQRASCTHSRQLAAEKLGVKLYGPAFIRAEKARDLDSPTEIWTLIADEEWVAFAWASGLIQTASAGAIPKGAVGFAKGPRRALEAVLGVVARHGTGKSAGKLLVPGVPESGGQSKAMDAVLDWQKWCAKRNGKQNSLGVVFAALKGRQ